MALASVLRVPLSPREATSEHRKTIALPVVWAALLTILIAWPWLTGGYVFGTDWPAPRHFYFPTSLYSSAPLEAALAAISLIVPGEWVGKLLVLGLLFTAGLLAYRAAPVPGFVARAGASTVYLVNPLVFGRLHYGQLYLLAGYALLPLVLIGVRAMLDRPGLKKALALAVSVALVGVFTTHLVLECAVLVFGLVLADTVASRNLRARLKLVGSSLLIAMGAVLAISGYWVGPLLLGRGPIANVISGIGAGDLRVYAAVADPRLGLVPNLLGLYGFWAENTGRFTSMKAFVPLWPVALLAVLAVAAVGVFGTLRRRSDPMAPWVVGLLIAAAAALVLEMGVSNPLSSGFVTWLDSTFPIYRGMRDAGKWAALLALVYSQLFALGAAMILEWVNRPGRLSARTDWIAGAVVGLLLALPLYYGNGLLFGMHGEIQPSQYPAGWYDADRALLADPQAGRALLLPWHKYMAFSFIRNENKVVASPAPTFFSVPVLTSSDPELPGVAPPTNADQVAVGNLVRAGPTGRWAEELAALGVKYVLVAHEVDWQSYRFLDSAPGFVHVGAYGSIDLYRVVLSP